MIVQPETGNDGDLALSLTMSKDKDTTVQFHNNVQDPDEKLIFINAMNKWAPGMVLEPSNLYGTKLFQMIHDAKQHVQQDQCSSSASLLSLPS
jgi:Glycosyltransferase WbsX